MGIYIPGVEPPRHCFGCSTKVDPDNRRCNIDGHLFEETLSKITSRRDDHCPIVTVPPHGRLIDADDLANSITGAIYHSDLLDAPTVIPAEEAQP